MGGTLRTFLGFSRFVPASLFWYYFLAADCPFHLRGKWERVGHQSGALTQSAGGWHLVPRATRASRRRFWTPGALSQGHSRAGSAPITGCGGHVLHAGEHLPAENRGEAEPDRLLLAPTLIHPRKC